MTTCNTKCSLMPDIIPLTSLNLGGHCILAHHYGKPDAPVWLRQYIRDLLCVKEGQGFTRGHVMTMNADSSVIRVDAPEPEKFCETVPGLHEIKVGQASAPNTILYLSHVHGGRFFINSDEYRPLMKALRNARDFMVRTGRWRAEDVTESEPIKSPSQAANPCRDRTIDGRFPNQYLRIQPDSDWRTSKDALVFLSAGRDRCVGSCFNREQLTQIRDTLNEILEGN